MDRKTIRKSGKRLLAVASASAVAFLVRQSRTVAAQYTWSGAGGTTFWGTGNNWSGTAPSNSDSPADDLTFAGSTGIANANQGAGSSSTSNLLAAVNSITFAPGSGAFTLSAAATGTPLSIDGAILNNSNNTQTLKQLLSITSGDNATFTNTSLGTTLALANTNASAIAVGSSSALTFAGLGAISMAGGMVLNSGSSLIVSATGTDTITGAITGATAAGVSITGGGTLSLASAASTYAGGTTITNGALLYSATGTTSLGSTTTGPIVLGAAGGVNSATLSLSGATGNLTNGILVNSLAGGSVTIAASGSANSISTGTLSFTAGSALSIVDSGNGAIFTMGNPISSTTNSSLVFNASSAPNGGTSSTFLLNQIDVPLPGNQFLGTVTMASPSLLELGFSSRTPLILSLGGISLANASSLWIFNGPYAVSVNAPIILTGSSAKIIGGTTAAGATYPTDLYYGAIGQGASPATLSVDISVSPANGTKSQRFETTNSYTGGTNVILGPIGLGASDNGSATLDAMANNALGGGTGGIGGALSFQPATVTEGNYTGPTLTLPNPGQGNVNATDAGGVYLGSGFTQTIAGLDNTSMPADQGGLFGANNNASSISVLNISGTGSAQTVYSGMIGGAIISHGSEGNGSEANISVVKSGGGTQALTGLLNGYKQGTTITGGVLQISNDANLGYSSSPVALNGGTLEIAPGVTFSNFSASGTFTNAPTVAVNVGSAPGAIAPKPIATGNITASNIALLTGATSSFSSAPTITIGSNNIVDYEFVAPTVSAILSNGTSGSITGFNVTAAANEGFFTGGETVTITGGGGVATASITGITLTGLTAISSGFNVGASPTVTITGGSSGGSGTVTATAVQVNNITLNSGRTISLGSGGGTMQIDGSGTNVSFAGPMVGASNSVFSLTGGGTLLLNSASTASVLTYAGITDIAGSTLSLAGHSYLGTNSQVIVGDTAANSNSVLDISGYTGNSGSYVIKSGQILSGHGTVVTGGNTLAFASGSSLQPGGTPGTLGITGALSVASGANLAYDMSGGASTVAVSGLLTFGGSSTSQVNLALSNLTPGTYDLFTYTSYVGDQGPGNDGIITGDFNFSGLNGMTPTVTETGTGTGAIVLSVPEPSSLSLLGLGALSLLGRRRRKTRKQADVNNQSA